MMDLDDLKTLWKTLVGNCRHEDLFGPAGSNHFGEFSKYLRPDAPILDEIILVKTDWINSSRLWNINTLSDEEKLLRFSKENYALLGIINRIQLSDLNQYYHQTIKNRVFVPPHASLTCDRVFQSSEFDKVYYTEQPKKKTFFFLIGDAKQAHVSLPKRFGHQIGGKHFEITEEDNKSAPEGQKWTFIKLKPEPSGLHDVQARLINLLREAFAKFSAQPPGRDLLRQTLAGLYERSFFLRHFTAVDSVFVLITIDKALWHPILSPEVVRRFIEDFCAAPLPDDAPDFFFFFGIEYPQADDTVKSEVKTIIDNRTLGHALSDLQPVQLDWVVEWFSRHEVLIPNGKTAQDLSAIIFPGETVKDMLDIEHKLLEIILLYNKVHLLWTENLK